MAIDPKKVRRILDERLAAGDISKDEYREILAELKSGEERIGNRSENESAKAATTKNQWYYSTKGTQYGPVDEAEIIRKIQNGELAPGSLVRVEGSMDWQPAHNHLCFQERSLWKRVWDLGEDYPKETGKGLGDQLNEVFYWMPPVVIAVIWRVLFCVFIGLVLFGIYVGWLRG